MSGGSSAGWAFCVSSSACTSTSFAPWTSTSSEGPSDARPRAQLFTVGHSTRSFEELVALLQDYGIRQLIDVRHFPRSRRNPHVNQETLARELPGQGISYHWEGETLGGFRKGGYQAHMETQLFADGIARLERLVRRAPSAVMCAEIVWFRCHRRFIAREMVARGYRVTHIVNRGKPGYEEPLPNSAAST